MSAVPVVIGNRRWKLLLTPVDSVSWDLGGQPRFRTMWERYCRGVNAIVYEV